MKGEIFSDGFVGERVRSLAGRRPLRVPSHVLIGPVSASVRFWMKSVLTLLLCAVTVCSIPTLSAFGKETSAAHPYGLVVPLRNMNRLQVKAAVQTQSSVPMWEYQITSPIDGMNYTGMMVGASPFFNGARTISIPAIIVPLIIKMPDGGVFDPTVTDTCTGSKTPLAQVQGSPVLQSAQFTMNGINMGTGQYVDEFQRANFYNANVSITGDSYHTVLSPITTLAAQTVTIPSGEGATYYRGCADHQGVMDFNTFYGILTNTLIPGLANQGVGPTTLPIFVMHNVVMGDPGISPTTNCCVLGFHGAYGSSQIQTYAVADFDTTDFFSQEPDIADLSHEVAEWMNDPLGINPTPQWGNVGQVVGCQGNLEVGDPLTGTVVPAVTMPNGVTYHPQELAFYSWFFRESPSIGASGLYSDNGTFRSGAGPVCQ
jgi:hypothetical protein